MESDLEKAPSTSADERTAPPSAHGIPDAHEPAALEPIRTAPGHGHGHTLGKTETSASLPPLAQAESRRTYGGVRWVLVCVALYLSAFLYGLDTTIVADIQSAAVETFGEVQKLAWLGIGFPLGSIAVILPVGKAFGIFDIKWVFVISLVMFEAGSALCGGSPTMNALIVGRVWAGAGGAGMYLGVLNILSLNTTLAERNLYIAGCGLVWGVGCILGPVIGGSFADSSATWRWAFYLNLLIFAVCSPIYIFVIDSFNPDPHSTRVQKLKRLDWVGITLNAALYVCFVLAFTFGGSQWDWSSGRIIALIVVFGVLLIAFMIQQTFSIFTTPENRLFPIDFLKHRTMVLIYIAMSACGTSLFIPIYYIPLYFSFAKGDSSIDAAVRLLPFICVTIFCTMINGGLMPKFGYYSPWYLASGIFLVAGGAPIYALLDVNSSPSLVYGLSVLCAIGAGIAQQAAYSIAQAKVPVHRIADAVGYINSAQLGATVIALTVTGAVFQNVGFRLVSDAVAGLDFSPEEIHAALAGVKSSIFTSISPEVRAKVLGGIVQAIRNSFALVFVAGAVNILAALGMKYERLFMEVSAGA